MNRKEAIEKIINDFCKLRVWCELYPDDCQKEDCEMWWAIQALQNPSKPNNTCEVDLISRRDVIAEFRDGRDVYDIMESIEELPSAEPKTGEWVDIDNYYRMATCSRCHKVTMFEKWGEYTRSYNFCPNCGADMRGGEEDGKKKYL